MSATNPEKTSPTLIAVANNTTILSVKVYPCSRADAETVLLLHGGPGVPEEFEFVVALLNSKYQVVNFEQRGLGQSENPSGDYSIEAYISDIEAIALHLNLDKFHLFGHSWGGLYAQIYAQEHHERLKSLFLSSPSSGTNYLWEQTETEVFAYNRQRCKSEWTFLLMGWYSFLGSLVGMDSSLQQLFVIVFENYSRDYPDSHAPVVTVDQLRAIKGAPVQATRRSIVEYPALSQQSKDPGFPIQITYGDGDIYGPSREEVPKRYPSAQVATIPNCGHLPWWHNPEEFASILRQFYSLDQ